MRMLAIVTVTMSAVAGTAMAGTAPDVWAADPGASMSGLLAAGYAVAGITYDRAAGDALHLPPPAYVLQKVEAGGPTSVYQCHTVTAADDHVGACARLVAGGK